MYEILPYSYRKAKKLGVKISPSLRTGKKIDVYSKTWKYIVSIGDKNYLDYPTYLKYYGKQIADKRRKLYKIRHRADRMIKGSAGYYADQILW
mgnify:CR=1 FL=1